MTNMICVVHECMCASEWVYKAYSMCVGGCVVCVCL